MDYGRGEEWRVSVGDGTERTGTSIQTDDEPGS